MFVVLLPNGQPLLGTRSDTSQSAMAKAMMMDVPQGCCVIEMTNEEFKSAGATRKR